MLPPKDVEETITVEFDFTDLVQDLGLGDVNLGSPVVETGRDSGDGQLVAGTPQIAGLTLFQPYSGGTRHVTYEVACSATFSNGERRRISDFLLVI